MTQTQRSLLLINRQPPWAGSVAREALDIVLTAGAFELPVGLLLLDDGVFQLVSDQKAAILQQKDSVANLQALPLFGVENIYVSQRALNERGLEASTLLDVGFQILEDEALAQLMVSYDHLVTF